MIRLLLILFALSQSPTPEPYYGEPIPEPITVRYYSAPFSCPQLGDPHKINGYYYEDPDYEQTCWREHYYWIPGVPTYETQFLVMPDVVIGNAYAYEANLMEHTAEFHELTLDDVIDGVALPFCSEIGNYVWLKRPGHDWEGAFRVVDCAGLLDLYNVVVHRGEVVEIGFQTAIDWDMVKFLEQTGEMSWSKTWDTRKMENIIVSKINPKYLPQSIIPVNLVQWFKERATFYRTQAEWDLDYKPLSSTVDQVVFWRFKKNGQWMKFNSEEYK